MRYYLLTTTFMFIFTADLFLQGLFNQVLAQDNKSPNDEGQKVTISGRLNSEGKPVEFANISLLSTSLGTTSDTLGRFSLQNVPVGKYILQISAIGYYKYTQNIHVTKSSTININLTENISELSEVVVSGTMKETSVANSPIHTMVFQQSYFRKNPVPTFFEAMNMVNGVQPQLACNVCNTGDIHINGMEGAYTMVTIDGMPIVSGLSTVYGLMGIPSALIQRIEVVKGAASTLYGSEAVAGVINIITKSPLNSPRFFADAFSTTWGEHNTDIGISQSFKKAHSLLGINYFNFQNRIDRNGDNFTDMTLQNRISAFNKWSFTRKNNRIATIAGRYIYEDRFGGEMQWTKADRGTDNRYGESIYTARYELLGAYQLPLSKEKLTIQYSFNHHHQNSYYGTVSYIGTQRIGFMQLLWDKKIGKNDVLVGIPVRSTYYSDNSAVNFSGDSNKIGTTTNLVGAFVQDDIKINSKLSLLLSTRYDHSNTHGNIYSPRVAVKYAPRPYDIFRISAGNGFRVVNLATEDHAALSGARKVIVAEKLKPETSYSLTGNYQRLINHRYGFVTLDFGAFYTYFENKIVADYFVSPTQIVYDNLSGYGISQGFNFNLDFSFENSLKIIAGITYLDVYQVEKGEQQRTVHTPPLSGTYTVSYTLPKHNITFDLTGRVTSPMLLPVLPNDFRPDHSPYFNLANLQITKPFKNGIEIYGGIKNIFNFLPQNPIMRPFDPFDKNVAFDTAGNPLPTPDNPQAYTFDPTYNYAPMQGIRGFAGIRWRVDKQ